MAEWTPEAREYLDGYLKQVRALARSQGDDADGVGDYGTLAQLTAPGDGGGALLDEEFVSGVTHDYRFIIEVCPSGLDGSPHYQCVAVDTKPGLKKTRCYHLDEHGVISVLGRWEQETQGLLYQPD